MSQCQVACYDKDEDTSSDLIGEFTCTAARLLEAKDQGVSSFTTPHLNIVSLTCSPQVHCFDYDSDGSHDLIGVFQTKVAELLKVDSGSLVRLSSITAYFNLSSLITFHHVVCPEYSGNVIRWSLSAFIQRSRRRKRAIRIPALSVSNTARCVCGWILYVLLKLNSTPTKNKAEQGVFQNHYILRNKKSVHQTLLMTGLKKKITLGYQYYFYIRVVCLFMCRMS